MVLRADARNNHARILAAATEVFADKGLHAEMKAIAERAGVAVGTLYHHFPGKDELLLAIVHEAISAAQAGADAAEALPDPVEGLGALLTTTFVIAERYGWVVEALMIGQLPSACQAVMRARGESGYHTDRIRRLVRRGVEQRVLRPDLDVNLTAALLEGVALPWIYGRLRSTRSPREAAAAVIGTVLAGAAPRAD